MAVLSDYTSGTITVVQNSVNFTGTDTLWRTMRFREGDTVQLQGYTMVIKGVDEPGSPIESNTSGQFTESWPGTSGTFEYRMRYMSDGARVSGQSAELIELLGNGVLEGIAEVPVEDGKLLVGNAAGLYDLIDKSELGIQDPNGSLGKLAGLTLLANKFLNINGAGELVQSDITAAALVLLKLSGEPGANKLPFFDAADGAALADFPVKGRAFVAAQTEAAQRRLIGIGRPAFKAHLAANQLVYNGTTSLSFTAAPLNVGNAWSGGRFTISEAGTYFFMLNITIGDGFAGQIIPQIFVSNGVNPSSVYSECVMPIGPQSAQRFYAGGVVGAAVWLNAGSYVEFKVVLDAVQGNPYMGAFRCSATGFMM